MSTERVNLVPFPIWRHGKDGISFVNSVAEKMLELSPAAAERHLVRQLERKAHTLRRRGFDDATIKAETDKAQTAIRAVLLRCVFHGDAI